MYRPIPSPSPRPSPASDATRPLRRHVCPQLAMRPAPPGGCPSTEPLADPQGAPAKRGRHVSCERGCARDDSGEAGPFSVERLKMDLPFCAPFRASQRVLPLRRHVCPQLANYSLYTAKCRPSSPAHHLTEANARPSRSDERGRAAGLPGHQAQRRRRWGLQLQSLSRTLLQL